MYRTFFSCLYRCVRKIPFVLVRFLSFVSFSLPFLFCSSLVFLSLVLYRLSFFLVLIFTFVLLSYFILARFWRLLFDIRPFLLVCLSFVFFYWFHLVYCFFFDSYISRSFLFLLVSKFSFRRLHSSSSVSFSFVLSYVFFLVRFFLVLPLSFIFFILSFLFVLNIFFFRSFSIVFVRFFLYVLSFSFVRFRSYIYF